MPRVAGSRPASSHAARTGPTSPRRSPRGPPAKEHVVRDAGRHRQLARCGRFDRDRGSARPGPARAPAVARRSVGSPGLASGGRRDGRAREPGPRLDPGVRACQAPSPSRVPAIAARGGGRDGVQHRPSRARWTLPADPGQCRPGLRPRFAVRVRRIVADPERVDPGPVAHPRDLGETPRRIAGVQHDSQPNQAAAWRSGWFELHRSVSLFGFRTSVRETRGYSGRREPNKRRCRVRRRHASDRHPSVHPPAPRRRDPRVDGRDARLRGGHPAHRHDRPIRLPCRPRLDAGEADRTSADLRLALRHLVLGPATRRRRSDDAGPSR